MDNTKIQDDVVQVLNQHGITCDGAVSRIRREVQRAIDQQLSTDNKNKMHETFRKMYKGRTIYFDEPIARSQYYTDGVVRNEWVDVEQVTLYHYQPRKRLAWVHVPKGQLKAGQYRDNIQPLTLAELVRYGASTEKQVSR